MCMGGVWVRTRAAHTHTYIYIYADPMPTLRTSLVCTYTYNLRIHWATHTLRNNYPYLIILFNRRIYLWEPL